MSRTLRPRVVLFDVYNTLIEIRTNEHDPLVWEHLARFLRYQGLQIAGEPLRAAFFDQVRTMQQARGEAYPEIDMVRIFHQLLTAQGYACSDAFAVYITQLMRTLSMRRFRPFPDTLRSLRTLRGAFRLGIITDAQRVFVEPELVQAGIAEYFDVQVISSDNDFRKPDQRLFRQALQVLGVQPADAIYVGDNLFRDVYGAQAAGMRGVLVQRGRRQEAAEVPCTPDCTIRTLDDLVQWLLP